MVSNQPALSRRRFLRLTAAAGLGLGFAAQLLRSGEFQRVRETRLLMGSIANLTLLSDTPAAAQEAVQAAFDRMAYLESIFSRFRLDSTISRLNRDGYVRDAAPEFLVVLAESVRYGDLTGGAFDITVEPLLALYRDITRTGKLPSPQQTEAAHRLVNYRQVDLDSRSVRLRQTGMAVTLDGIAKGYIIDEGARVLVERGFDDVLVEVGGDMQARGAHRWQVGIQSPTASVDTPIQTVQVTNCALTTSGDYLNAFTPDHRLHHIIDPRTGLSPTRISSVSVVAPNACRADAISTGLMVLGVDDGMRLVEGLPAVRALFVTKDQQVIQTTPL